MGFNIHGAIQNYLVSARNNAIAGGALLPTGGVILSKVPYMIDEGQRTALQISGYAAEAVGVVFALLAGANYLRARRLQKDNGI
jgi:hypothetical protein